MRYLRSGFRAVLPPSVFLLQLHKQFLRKRRGQAARHVVQCVRYAGEHIVDDGFHIWPEAAFLGGVVEVPPLNVS